MLQVKNDIGKKYYQYDDDGKLSLVRITNIKDNGDTIIFRDEENHSNIKRLSKKEFSDNFTLLQPVGAVTITSVELEHGLKDIIVCLYKRNNTSSYTLYAVCRQNAYDVFSNGIKNKNDPKIYVGMSLSVDTCPKDVDFTTMTLCKSASYGEIVYIYLDDTIDTIIKNLLKINKFDKTLLELSDSIVQNPMQPMYGYCKTLLDLLKENHFDNDLHRAFNIVKTKFKIGENCILTEDYANQLEEILKMKLYDITLTRYWYDIDFSKFEKEYSIISDANDDLYIASYVSDGYKNDTYKSLSDHNEYDYLKKFISK